MKTIAEVSELVLGLLGASNVREDGRGWMVETLQPGCLEILA